MPVVFLSASSEYLELEPAPVAAAPLTIACWFYSDSDTADDTLMFLGDKDSEDDFWILEIKGGTANDPVYFTAKSSAGGTDSSPLDPGFTKDTWHSFVGVEAATNSRIVYLDGAAGTPDTGSNTPLAADRISIGGRRDASPINYFGGKMLWAAAWSTALSAEDAARHGNGVEPVFIRRDALVWYVRLVGDDYIDMISGTKLTIGGTPTISNDFPSQMVRALPRGRGRDRHRFT